MVFINSCSFNPNSSLWTKKTEINYFFILGVASAFFLFLHAYFLGRPDWKELYDVNFYRLFRRFIIISFILLELVAQFLLVIKLTKIRKSIDHLIKQKILWTKLFYSIFLVIGLISRLFGKQFIELSWDRSNETYWNNRTNEPPQKENYERQF